MQTIPLAPLLAKLGVMLSLAVMVERALTIISWLINKLVIVKSSTKWEGLEQKQEELELAQRAKAEENLLNALPGNPASAASDPREIEPRNPDAGPESRFDLKPISEPDQVKVLKEFWTQILGCLVAIVGCYYAKFSVWDFVTNWHPAGGGPAGEIAWWEAALTGIIIGAGSKPVHFLIDFLVTRKVVVTHEETKETAAQPPEAESASPLPAAADTAPPSPTSLPSLEEIAGFIDDGGDRPERLEHTHLRTKPIDLIIYHHTAMHAGSPFEEVIKAFERKGWLTGYHCVVMKDGSIRTQCRWDRIGNHAYGYNDRSLGVALHGNFETNPKVPGGNSNGAFGMPQPTPAQLEAAARIIALWALLYEVDMRFPQKGEPDFGKGIMPHGPLANKPCPGGNFPHEALQQRITDYAARWKNDADFQAALVKFKSLPMVMV